MQSSSMLRNSHSDYNPAYGYYQYPQAPLAMPPARMVPDPATFDFPPGTTFFQCPWCPKYYEGPNGRSIWRRHAQEKHHLPCHSRRSRWDNDPERPKDPQEKKERNLESKREWAKQNRAMKKLESELAKYDPSEAMYDVTVTRLLQLQAGKRRRSVSTDKENGVHKPAIRRAYTDQPAFSFPDTGRSAGPAHVGATHDRPDLHRSMTDFAHHYSPQDIVPPSSSSCHDPPAPPTVHALLSQLSDENLQLLYQQICQDAAQLKELSTEHSSGHSGHPSPDVNTANLPAVLPSTPSPPDSAFPSHNLEPSGEPGPSSALLITVLAPPFALTASSMPGASSTSGDFDDPTVQPDDRTAKEEEVALDDSLFTPRAGENTPFTPIVKKEDTGVDGRSFMYNVLDANVAAVGEDLSWPGMPSLHDTPTRANNFVPATPSSHLRLPGYNANAFYKGPVNNTPQREQLAYELGLAPGDTPIIRSVRGQLMANGPINVWE